MPEGKGLASVVKDTGLGAAERAVETVTERVAEKVSNTFTGWAHACIYGEEGTVYCHFKSAYSKGMEKIVQNTKDMAALTYSDVKINHKKLCSGFARANGAVITISNSVSQPSTQMGMAYWSVMEVYHPQFSEPHGSEEVGLIPVLLVLLKTCFSFLVSEANYVVFSKAKDIIDAIKKILDKEQERQYAKIFSCCYRQQADLVWKLKLAMTSLESLIDRFIYLNQTQNSSQAYNAVITEICIGHFQMAWREAGTEAGFQVVESDRTRSDEMISFFSNCDQSEVKARAMSGFSDFMKMISYGMRANKFRNAYKNFDLLDTTGARKLEYFTRKSKTFNGRDADQEKKKIRLYHLLRFLAIHYKHADSSLSLSTAGVFDRLLRVCMELVNELKQSVKNRRGGQELDLREQKKKTLLAMHGSPIPGTYLWGLDIINNILSKLHTVVAPLMVQIDSEECLQDSRVIKTIIDKAFSFNPAVDNVHAMLSLEDIYFWMQIFFDALNKALNANHGEVEVWEPWLSRLDTILISLINMFFFVKGTNTYYTQTSKREADRHTPGEASDWSIQEKEVIATLQDFVTFKEKINALVAGQATNEEASTSRPGGSDEFILDDIDDGMEPSGSLCAPLLGACSGAADDTLGVGASNAGNLKHSCQAESESIELLKELQLKTLICYRNAYDNLSEMKDALREQTADLNLMGDDDFNQLLPEAEVKETRNDQLREKLAHSLLAEVGLVVMFLMRSCRQHLQGPFKHEFQRAGLTDSELADRSIFRPFRDVRETKTDKMTRLRAAERAGQFSGLG